MSCFSVLPLSTSGFLAELVALATNVAASMGFVVYEILKSCIAQRASI